ncbi:MAG: 2Fe-2S iron-sulfur cluster-binding protein [Phycisphaerae bacterium]|nr:2Fe-2S iron-sulfur cluster-binding protein [Phycisphaerae bacterium]
MADNITLTIDGHPVSADPSQTVLDAARSAGVAIPTLCHHKDLLPYGGCRLCLVELRQGKRSQLVASCGYYAKAGLEVHTRSPRVLRARKLVLEVLLALMPYSEEIRRLAHENEVTETRYQRTMHYCVLCGLCVRYCDEVKHTNCIGFVGRGVERNVAWVPPDRYDQTCRTCFECMSLCPTGVFPSNFGLAEV